MKSGRRRTWSSSKVVFILISLIPKAGNLSRNRIPGRYIGKVKLYVNNKQQIDEIKELKGHWYS
jgi:hypothetical protein